VTDYDDLQKRLQRGGVGLHHANNLNAEAYAAIGELFKENQALRDVLEIDPRHFIGTATIEGLKDLRDQLKAENESLKGSCKAMGADMGKLTRERNSLRSRAEKLKAENEALRDLKLPGYLNLSAEMRERGDHAVSRAKEDGCASWNALHAAFFEAAIQVWLDDQADAVDAAMSKQSVNTRRSEQGPETTESPAQQGFDCGSERA